jgi:hypothetical protein
MHHAVDELVARFRFEELSEIAPAPAGMKCEQRRSRHGTPVRTVWVRALAALIEPRLPRAARGSGVRPRIPPSLIALLVAEMQIALITHWLTGRFAPTAEVVAANLIANTHALLMTQFPALARSSMALSVG